MGKKTIKKGRIGIKWAEGLYFFLFEIFLVLIMILDNYSFFSGTRTNNYGGYSFFLLAITFYIPILPLIGIFNYFRLNKKNDDFAIYVLFLNIILLFISIKLRFE